MGLGLEIGLPFVAFRKPNEQVLTAIFQSNANLNITKDFEDNGFVFAPFSLNEGVVLIQPDEVFQTHVLFESEVKNKELVISEDGQKEHIELVEKGIQAIQSGELKKVVLSRKIDLKISKNPIQIFKDVLGNYPNAFCYFFHHPKVGTWCGATPETLVRIKDGQLKTMSLAATLPYEENKQPEWGAKEIEEQQMVSDHIKDSLGNLMEDLIIEKAESIRAGKLWHLRSEVKGVPLPNTSLSEIINSLHPTPAVCGIPTKVAQDFILQNENYQRTYYTGFLGELNLWAPKEASLFVNLRCMELSSNHAAIFVGGGITAGSVPEQEWIETQNKSKTMLGIL
ncbi:chorismate-binding protein [Flagellimonas pelagia]|uniref:isochorismate synthase n=1 Tax=Flagellimonas pelagia TaxID=2306998 RepID=A0A3A1NJR3_9FLAO|nr:chorismate-binding protein [Allomuricauda maritima]RIV46126.1 isochorismate synthase [Allomuricauda maritima]TXJ98721.1 isochorismate synthase [Allomuricauda maritima]